MKGILNAWSRNRFTLDMHACVCVFEGGKRDVYKRRYKWIVILLYWLNPYIRSDVAMYEYVLYELKYQ